MRVMASLLGCRLEPSPADPSGQGASRGFTPAAIFARLSRRAGRGPRTGGNPPRARRPDPPRRPPPPPPPPRRSTAPSGTGPPRLVRAPRRGDLFGIDGIDKPIPMGLVA